MINWINTTEETKRKAYFQIAENLGMTAFAVEKDWWVVQTLSSCFETSVAGHLVFKGGTSLSKAWNVLRRFSEDIDLAINREFFGFTGDLSKNKRDKLRKQSGSYVAHTFFPELKARFLEKGFRQLNIELVEEIESDKDRKINVYYPNVIPSPGYLQPRVQIEITSRSLREPFTVRSFSSLIDEAYPEAAFTQFPIKIPSVNPERTFLEKIFLLHEEFQRPQGKIRVERLSRHLYDVAILSKTKFGDKGLTDKVLYETIVEHRHKFTRIGGINYNFHNPRYIKIIPNPNIIDAWRKDYKTMIEQMIWGENPPSFDNIIVELEILQTRINSLPWELSKKYPVLDI